MAGLVELPGVGKATRCELGNPPRTHVPRRFVWHHILPQACGGKTEAGNLAQVCDSCHYAVHDLMWWLAQGQAPARPWTGPQMALAEQGYQAAVAAGTAGHMPKEA